MKVYSSQQLENLKSIIFKEMSHMGNLDEFEQIEDCKFRITMSKNEKSYFGTIEFEEEIGLYMFIIRTAFCRLVLKRQLNNVLFPFETDARITDQRIIHILNEIKKELKDIRGILEHKTNIEVKFEKFEKELIDYTSRNEAALIKAHEDKIKEIKSQLKKDCSYKTINIERMIESMKH